MTDGERGRRDRGPVLVLAGSVALLVGILAIAVVSATTRPGPGGEAARLAPASALAFARLSTDSDDVAARRLHRLAPRIPGYLALRDAALTAVSPAPGAFDPRRDVRPWLGDEAAVALVDIGGGRFASLVLAQVRSRPRAEALLQRVAGEQAGVPYRGAVLRRFGGNAAAFVGGFLAAGPEPAVRRVVDVARGAPALGDAEEFEAALEGAVRPVEAYVSPRGLRGAIQPRGGVTGAVAALLDHPRLRGVGASAWADARGLRVSVRRMGAGANEVRPELIRGVPADAVAVVAGADFAAAQAAQRAAGPALLAPVRAALRKRDLDLDRDLLGRLRGEFAAWISPGAAAPVIGLAVRTRDPRGTREALARLQGPLAGALADQATGPGIDPGAAPAFEPRTIAGAEAFTLPVTDAFAPSYSVAGDTVVIATSPAGIEAFRGRRPRLRTARAFRAAVPRVPARVESLSFVDVSGLVALGARTGLRVDAFRPVRAAGAVA